MSEPLRIDPNALDRYITGNYGEDQFRDHPDDHPSDCAGWWVEPDYEYDPDMGGMITVSVRVECHDDSHAIEQYGEHAFFNDDDEVRLRGCESHGDLDPTSAEDKATLAMCAACRHE